MTGSDPSSFSVPQRRTVREVEFRQALEQYIAESVGTNVEKLQNFAKFVPVQDMRRFLSRYEVFKLVLNVHGDIVEGGVLYGGGVMTWALLSEVFEPFNHLRRVVGFDTFTGRDSAGLVGQNAASDTFEDLTRAVALYDANRPLGHLPKVTLVRGDATTTMPAHLEAHPETVVSLLALDFDTYEPTVVALQTFLPRMPKGGVVVFDELNHPLWPGETAAVLEAVGLRSLRLQRFPWGGTVSYSILE